MNRSTERSNTSLGQAVIDEERKLLDDSESATDDAYECELIQVSKTIVKYVLNGQELQDNLKREAKLFNRLKCNLPGVGNIRSIEVFKCEETTREYEATREEFRLSRKVRKNVKS